MLIADPKQAIYAFRGADVYAYLVAAATASTRATLPVNRRSDQALLDAYDALFGDASARAPGIVYRQVSAAPGHEEPRLLGRRTRRRCGCGVVHRDEPGIERTPTGLLRAHVGPRARRAGPRGGHRRGCCPRTPRSSSGARTGSDAGAPLICAGDIAVLVRTHTQADLIRPRSTRRAFPAVINGAGSVFATPPRATGCGCSTRSTARRRLARADRGADAIHRLERRADRDRRRGGLGGGSPAASPLEPDPARAGRRRADRGDHGRRGAARPSARERRRRAAADRPASPRAAAAPARPPPSGSARRPCEAGSRSRSRPPSARTARRSARVGSSPTRRRSRSSRSTAARGSSSRSSTARSCGRPAGPRRNPSRCSSTIPAIGDRRDDRRRARRRPASASTARSNVLEERGEELRLAYVALTRAKHAGDHLVGRSMGQPALSARPAAALPRTRRLRRRGRRTTIPPDDERARAARGARSRGAPGCISVGARRGRTAVARARRRSESPAELVAARFDRALDLRWRRTSYSDITAAAHEQLVTSEPEEPILHDEPETPTPVPALGATPAELALASPIGGMPVGVTFGTLVHRVFEATDFAADDLDGELSEQVELARQRRPARARQRGRRGRRAARRDRDAARGARRRSAPAGCAPGRPARRARVRAPARRRG